MIYILAYRNDRVLNIRLTDKWLFKICDYLMDLGYQLNSGSEQHWKRMIDEFGRPTLTYDLSDEDYFFDVGT